jgi:hypothetical protein
MLRWQNFSLDLACCRGLSPSVLFLLICGGIHNDGDGVHNCGGILDGRLVDANPW